MIDPRDFIYGARVGGWYQLKLNIFIIIVWGGEEEEDE